MKDILAELIKILGQDVADVCTLNAQESETRWPNGRSAKNYLVYVWPPGDRSWILGNTLTRECVLSDAARLRDDIRQAIGLDKPAWDPIEKGA